MEYYLQIDKDSPTNERMDDLSDEELEELYYNSIEYEPELNDDEKV